MWRPSDEAERYIDGMEKGIVKRQERRTWEITASEECFFLCLVAVERWTYSFGPREGEERSGHPLFFFDLFVIPFPGRTKCCHIKLSGWKNRTRAWAGAKETEKEGREGRKERHSEKRNEGGVSGYVKEGLFRNWNRVTDWTRESTKADDVWTIAEGSRLPFSLSFFFFCLHLFFPPSCASFCLFVFWGLVQIRSDPNAMNGK